MKALLSFAPLYLRHARAMTLALVLSLVTLLAGIGLLGTSGWFITATALTTAGLAFNLFVPSALVRGFSFIRILARYGERLVGHNATLNLLSDLRGWLFGALFPRLPLSGRVLRNGDLVSRLTSDVDALDTAFLVAIGPWSAALAIGIGMTLVLALLLPAAAPLYGIAAAFAALVVPLGMMALGRHIGHASVEAGANLRLSVLDGVQGHADLTLLGALGTAQARFNMDAALLARLRTRLAAMATLGGFAVQLLAAMALVGTLWAGLVALDTGALDAPVMVGLLLAVLGSFEANGLIVRSVGKAIAAMAAAERLRALADISPPIADPAQPQSLPANGDIVLAGVHFSYDGRIPVLADLNLRVAPGERVAITGPSGGGKSTLLRLLLRLADPQAGAIGFAGVQLAAASQDAVHARFALLSQDSPVFIDTIRNNLLIGRADADEPALWAALAQAQVDDVVRTLPQGLETVVGEAGRTLSVGQARRLCLARALLSQAPVILLDEPTEALDRATEEAFFATFSSATRGRTIIMATHAALPPGTVDRSLILQNGRLLPAP